MADDETKADKAEGEAKVEEGDPKKVEEKADAEKEGKNGEKKEEEEPKKEEEAEKEDEDAGEEVKKEADVEPKKEEEEEKSAEKAEAKKAEAKKEEDDDDAETGGETPSSSGAKQRTPRAKKRKKSQLDALLDGDISVPTSTKRERKSLTSYKPEDFAHPDADAEGEGKEPRDELPVPIGRGTRLGEMDSVRDSIKKAKMKGPVLAAAHKLVFSTRGRAKARNMKPQLLKFYGYLPPVNEDVPKEEWDQIEEDIEAKFSEKAYRIKSAMLKDLCDLFDVDRRAPEGKTIIGKDELVDRLLNFLGEPKEEMTKTAIVAKERREGKKAGTGVKGGKYSVTPKISKKKTTTAAAAASAVPKKKKSKKKKSDGSSADKDKDRDKDTPKKKKKKAKKSKRAEEEDNASDEDEHSEDEHDHSEDEETEEEEEDDNNDDMDDDEAEAEAMDVDGEAGAATPSGGGGDSTPSAEKKSSSKKSKLPGDKDLRKWVRAYVRCFNLDKATTKHAIETASDKFGVDLTEKKGRIKELLTEEMS